MSSKKKHSPVKAERVLSKIERLKPLNEDPKFQIELHQLMRSTTKRGKIEYKLPPNIKTTLTKWVQQNYFCNSKFIPPNDNHEIVGSYAWHILKAMNKVHLDKEHQLLFYSSIEKECTIIMQRLRCIYTRALILQINRGE